ncbi:MAG: DNA mismatch repair endonuclease MutL [Clostridia bacterium]|nr:DNA mismatch repair endonuclease MutL [Clostridia bacterium]
MKINILDKNLANMIAAGEVVERPASAVKELIENSVDAHAKNITVEIKNGGMSYIRVTDDGDGIHPDDAITAFARHATSKIATKEDLDKIYTLGFRGEALASIAAVARVDMFTKTRESDLGVNVVIEGGEVIEHTEVGCPDGTTMIIRNLFFNTPARMKFLKNDAAETTAITDVVNKMILCHPDVAIKLISNGKTVVSSHGTGNVEDCIHVVYGADYARNMIEVKYNEEHISVTGSTGSISLSRKDRRHQVFFLNGRNIVNKTISAAVAEAYRNAVMVGKHPVCVLYINIAPGLVDVNVHPTKMEVRFSNDKKIYSAIYWAVKEAITNTRHIPEITDDKVFSAPKTEMKVPEIASATQPEMPIKPIRAIPKTDTKTEYVRESIRASIEKNSRDNAYTLPKFSDLVPTFREVSPTMPVRVEVEEESAPKVVPPPVEEIHAEQPPVENITSSAYEEHNPKIIEKEEFLPGRDFTLVGQVFNTYIIAQSGDDMLLIDQHAAHERIWFEELMEQWKNNSISGQNLLLPVTVSLDRHDFSTVEDNLSFFSEVGFEIDIFGTEDIIVRKVPIEMDDALISDTVGDIINILQDNAVVPKHELYEKTLHTVACKRALKGGKHLAEGDMVHLVSQVMALEGINTCPHGRPICIRMSRRALEKQFKRIV